MLDQPRWRRAALLLVAAGLAWLWYAASFGVIGFLFAVIPGCLLVASGVGILLWPGDLRIPQFAALGGLIGVPFALPAIFVAGPGAALLLIALSAAAFVTAGHLSVLQEPQTPDVPEAEPSLRLAAQVAADDTLLAFLQLLLPMPRGGDWLRIRAEVEAARQLFAERGWLEKPDSYHLTPPPLLDPQIRRRRARGVAFEHLHFESGYAPHPEEPGCERWLGYAANRVAHAWVLRHPGPPRPWLMCLHGFQMGWPLIDLTVFAPEHFHQRLRMNLVMPVLPLHGERKKGKRSGDGFLAGDILDTIHAEAQSMWDLRRLLSWVRAQDAPAVGAFGLSLGGYQTSLLACLDDGLACAIPGIPLSDISRVVWRHGPPLQLRYGEHHGVDREAVVEVLRVVSPLALEPKVPQERRYVFAGVADRLVPPDQIRDLWRHWDRPRIVWYQGAHLTFRAHASVRHLVRDALKESGLTA